MISGNVLFYVLFYTDPTKRPVTRPRCFMHRNEGDRLQFVLYSCFRVRQARILNQIFGASADSFDEYSVFGQITIRGNSSDNVCNQIMLILEHTLPD